MTISELLQSEALWAACGLGAVAFCALQRYRRHRRIDFDAAWPGVAFLAGCFIPMAAALLLFPFLSDPPECTNYSYFFPLAGMSTLWSIGAAVRQAVVMRVSFATKE